MSVYECTHASEGGCVRACGRVLVHMSVNVCVHVGGCACECVHACECIHVRECEHVCGCDCVPVCVSVCECEQVRVCSCM